MRAGRCTPGYQLWAGGSLGTAPRLVTDAAPVPAAGRPLGRRCGRSSSGTSTEGDVDQVAKGRLKFVVEAKGESAFRQAFTKRFAALREGCGLAPPPIALPDSEDAGAHGFAHAPTLGWRDDIRPERVPGLASITVRVPLGDLLADHLDAVSSVAPEGRIVLTRAQNILVPSVPVERRVAGVGGTLADIGLGPDGARGRVDVRACPGLTFCSLAITGSQPVALAIEQSLNVRTDLPRDVSIAVSGCPNSCTKQQGADIGLSGTKVKLDGVVGPGYQLYLGADLPRGLLSDPVLRLVEHEVPAATIAAVELWVALRRPGETIGVAFRRAGLDLVRGGDRGALAGVRVRRATARRRGPWP